MNIESRTYILPAFWASDLINGDRSDLDQNEINQIDAFMDSVKPWYCVGCSDEPYFRWSNAANNFGGNVLEYTFHKMSK